MMRELTTEDPDRMRLYLARHEGDLVAATLWIRVGTHAWYSCMAPRPRPSGRSRGRPAVQWQMMRDALEAGGPGHPTCRASPRPSARTTRTSG